MANERRAVEPVCEIDFMIQKLMMTNLSSSPESPLPAEGHLTIRRASFVVVTTCAGFLPL